MIQCCCAGVLEEYSDEELRTHCVKLKEMLVVMEEISSDLHISLHYGMRVVIVAYNPSFVLHECYFWSLFPHSDTGMVLSELAGLMERTEHWDSNGQFEWVDSVLVTALKHGDWLCITNCNVCK